MMGRGKFSGQRIGYSRTGHVSGRTRNDQRGHNNNYTNNNKIESSPQHSGRKSNVTYDVMKEYLLNMIQKNFTFGNNPQDS